LRAAGYVEGGRFPLVVVVAAPVDSALAQAWSARVQDGVAVRWRGFVDRWARRGQLPPSADYAALAALWAARVGPERVRVVVAGDLARTTAATAGIVGVRLDRARPGARRTAAPESRDLSAEAVDVLRRVSAVLGVRLPQPGHQQAVRRLAGLLEGSDRPHRLTVPDPHRPWVSRRASEVAETLRRGGYAVAGDLTLLAQVGADAPSAPRRRAELTLVLDACARLAALDLAAEGGA
jgi:hypothetical protein